MIQIMTLKDLLKNAEYKCISGNINAEIKNIAYDSRKVSEGTLFVCLKGSAFDGHKFIDDAVARGAIAVVVSQEVNVNSVTVIKVENTRKVLAYISAEYFGNPAREIKTIGITGTKGKTTVSCMIRSILQKSGIKAGVIGTLGVVIDNDVIKTENTTPESYEIQKYLRLMVDKGCKCVIIEASSIGLRDHRLDGFEFDFGVFTNFSEDHVGGNEHKDMAEYLQCKSMLFKKCKFGLLNQDDSNLEGILKGHTCEYETFGFSEASDFIAYDDKLISNPGYVGVHFELRGKQNLSVNVDIPGRFSVYNALAAIAVCRQLQISEKAILNGLDEVKVKGRIEVLEVPGNYTLLIDYAHNAVSMENVLKTLRQYNPNRLIVLFGAGGNRPKVRRYEMGEAAGNLADLSVVTEDNSRNESVLDIISDIEKGLAKTNGKYVVIPDRKEAIKYCMVEAQDGDIIVLAGKGHEDYQEKNGVKTHFDEREIVKDILTELYGD